MGPKVRREVTQAPSKPKPLGEWGQPLQRFRDMPGESQDHRTRAASDESYVVHRGCRGSKKARINVSSHRIDSRPCSPVVRTRPAQWPNSTRLQWSTANVSIPPCHKSQKSSQNLQRFRTMRREICKHWHRDAGVKKDEGNLYPR